MTAPALDTLRRTIPFDYAFRFKLIGEVEKVHRETVRVSVESPFVAVAIGYGVIPKRDPLRFGPAVLEDIDPDDAELDRVREAFTKVRPLDPPPTKADLLALSTKVFPPGFFIPKRAGAPVVSGSTSLVFGTTTIPSAAFPPKVPAARSPITDEDIANMARLLVRPTPRPAEAINWPPPVAEVRSSWIGNSLRRVIREEGPTSLGVPRRGAARAADEIEVLGRGVRFNPEILESLQARGATAGVDLDELPRLFEEIPVEANRIQFLYALYDEGTGRAFQTDPLLSTAGLGIDDGDRPFRQFAVPIVFEPRTTIRMDVIERSDAAGELHVSLHGYRVLGGAGTPTDPRRGRLR